MSLLASKGTNLAGIGTDAFSRRFDRFAPTLTEKAILAEFRSARHVVAKRKELVHESHTAPVAYILHDGWMCSYKRLPDGGRQVVNIQLPGDIVGLNSLFLQTSDQSIEALTDTIVSEIGRGQLLSAMRQSPRLAEAVMWSFARDEAIIAQHLANLGRRSALGRTAHFLLELGFRLQEAGRATASGYDCPLSQQLLADALGLTSIHFNRILRYLREKELLLFSGGAVEFLNRPALTQLAGFDPSYLEVAGS
ncbi:Crp/Fnr family transcriptional regulator [Mesorhizobium sp. 1B3]|uniref:Crp/Fnr family transcriptional regulator n=1 Tax=Mesorhizobium sp. 1B3 TaxID=3243599 RepID=UPI003D961F2E